MNACWPPHDLAIGVQAYGNFEYRPHLLPLRRTTSSSSPYKNISSLKGPSAGTILSVSRHRPRTDQGCRIAYEQARNPGIWGEYGENTQFVYLGRSHGSTTHRRRLHEHPVTCSRAEPRRDLPCHRCEHLMVPLSVRVLFSHGGPISMHGPRHAKFPRAKGPSYHLA